MKLIDFSQTGGYRLKQPTFEKMQSAYYEILKAFITYLQIPDNGNYIISGCTISGADITSGMMYIDGELCPFVSVPGTLTTKIKKEIITEVLSFKNGSNPPVFRTTNAIVDASGVELQNFVRVPGVPVLPNDMVIDANYVHTDNNFTDLLLAKLNAIEAGAEVNVQADWDEINPLSDSYIRNKPNITTWYHKGVSLLGHLSSLTTLYGTIPINFPDIGTDEYFVIGYIKASNNVPVVFCHALTKTSNSFQIRYLLTNSSLTATNCEFEYYLLPTV